VNQQEEEVGNTMEEEQEEEEDSADLSLDSRLIEAKCTKSSQKFVDEHISTLNIVSTSLPGTKNMLYDENKFLGNDGGHGKEFYDPEEKSLEQDVIITELDDIMSEVRTGLEASGGISGPEDHFYRTGTLGEHWLTNQLEQIQEEDVPEEGGMADDKVAEDPVNTTGRLMEMNIGKGEETKEKVQQGKEKVAEEEDNPRSEPAPSCLPVEADLPHLTGWGSESLPAVHAEEEGKKTDMARIAEDWAMEGLEKENSPCDDTKEYDRAAYKHNPVAEQHDHQIQRAIAKIEEEESQVESANLESPLTEEELKNLKNKCMSRWKANKEQPLPVQPPLVKDFSNSAKLIRFLEETQENDEKKIQSVKIVAHRINANLPRLSDLLGRPVAELAEEVLSLKLELEAESRTVAVLRAGLEQSQEAMQETVSRLQKENRQRQEAQRRQYGEAINRHQTFIDQLIEDKKAISQKCEALATELRTLERRSKENITALESRHTLEISRLKHMNESSDKLKRERWMDQKARKIKEQTVKSLEGEVEKIMKKHAQELAELRLSAQRQRTHSA